ncbi:hypothetical protein PMZ80_009845 [Knufia obscura]|uniref:Uncharacterized protein n=2 Tax=Knufia TaxID=430999 RepID=A0AAN8IAR9_9EURO|nr:hypothetical protein PMZ80_009845 [Knufia obscura]KAK5955940.1 hypothetical protein OHC33_002513 [Knufia fluminis]
MRRLDSFCRFDEKLDTRRKTAWTSCDVQQRQQYMLHGLLLASRCNDNEDVTELLNALRQNDSPQVLAQCLLHQIHGLQERKIIGKSDLDIHDVLSLAVEGLSQGPGPGARDDSSSFVMLEDLDSKPCTDGQVDGHTNSHMNGLVDGHVDDTHRGPNPEEDPSFESSDGVPDHAFTEDAEAVPQFPFAQNLIYNQPSTYPLAGRPFSYSNSPLFAGSNDGVNSVESRNANVRNTRPLVTHSADGLSMPEANSANSALCLETSPNNPVQGSRMIGAHSPFNASVVDPAGWNMPPPLVGGLRSSWTGIFSLRCRDSEGG